MTIRSIIVDDEPLAVQGIQNFLKAMPDIEIAGTCSDGSEAVDLIRELKPDLVFLDIQMPGLDGFGVIEQVGAGQMPPVIFITAYDEYALRAFQVHAVEYLLKPLQEEDFMRAVSRARALISQPSDESLKNRLNALLESIQSERTFLERILVKEKDRTKVIPVEDIDWIESQDNYISLHTGTSQYLVRNKISVLESRLNPKQFTGVIKYLPRGPGYGFVTC